MVNHRLRQNGLPGEASPGQYSLAAFADGSFDAIVAIGCLHATGDLRGAIASCRRLLAPGGRLIGMVYYAYSYRRLWNERARTVRHLMQELCGQRGTIRDGNTFAYDHAKDGALAPSTEFVSSQIVALSLPRIS